MIALPGVCISVHRYEEAESILRTFAAYERRGLMPNLFPEGGNDPMYNTVDAALLFINCVWLYSEASGNTDFVEEMYPVMERIIESYKAGTDYEIRMDEDSLIMAGSGLDQVTWMDVRVGEILPTPPPRETGGDQCILVQRAQDHGEIFRYARENPAKLMRHWRTR